MCSGYVSDKILASNQRASLLTYQQMRDTFQELADGAEDRVQLAITFTTGFKLMARMMIEHGIPLPADVAPPSAATTAPSSGNNLSIAEQSVANAGGYRKGAGKAIQSRGKQHMVDVNFKARVGGPSTQRSIDQVPGENRDEDLQYLADRLLVPTINLLATFDNGNLARAKLAFFWDISKLQVIRRKHNQPESYELTPNQCHEVTVFFFDDLLSNSSVSQLINICTEYSTHDANEPDSGLWARASDCARDESLGPVIQELFSAVAATRPYRQKNTPLALLESMHANVTLMRKYKDFEARIRAHEKGIIDVVATEGFYTTQGRGFASVAKEYMCFMLKITPPSFDTTILAGRQVEAITSVFGDGIIPFLPHGTTSK